MRLGVIARTEAGRGLANQTYEVCRHLDPDRVLLIDPGRDGRFTQHPERYEPWETTTVRWQSGRLDETTVRRWLKGLDCLYSAETPYDLRLPQWAAEAGCGVVVQANPEFLGPADAKAAVTWWVATPWRMEHLPARTRVVPMPVVEPPFRHEPGERVQFLHTAGWPAVADRNGTQVVAQAAEMLTVDAEVIIRGQHPDINRFRRRAVRVEQGCVADYWDNYRDADILVLPRRFGGLCLATGTPVVRPDGSRTPIDDLAVGDEVSDDTGATSVAAVAERYVEEVVRIKARGPVLSSSVDHLHLIADTPEGPLLETKAADVQVGDWMQIVQPGPEGVRHVEVGPRPTRKGLQYWWESVELDEGWARVVGLFLAEGHSGLYSRSGRDRPQATIVWNFGPTAKPLAEEVVQILSERGIHADLKRAPVSAGTYGPSQTWRVRCRNTWLYEFFEALGIGHDAWGKRAPDVPADLVPALVGGWLDGDGNVDGGTVSGFSRSTQMISDLWRLLAKRGVLGSITHDGQRLDVGDQESAAEVASWTWRLEITKKYKRKIRAYRWRRNDTGWRVRVGSVERCEERTKVVAIETTSGRYIANDLVTHNCLPVLEALAVGLPVVMSETSPNEMWPGPRVPATSTATVGTRAGLLPLHDTDPRALAATMDELAANPDLVDKLRAEAADWMSANTWEVLKPMWLEELARACW